MKNNSIVNVLFGWVIIGGAYMLGKRNGYNKGVFRCKEILVDSIIEQNTKKDGKES